MEFDEQYIDVVGLRTRYLCAGSGPPLVLLHGAGENATDWQWVLPALARTHRVYAPDLPGYGGTRYPRADYSPTFFTRFVASFLTALGVDQVVVIGNSLGGINALILALAVPNQVRALVLVDSAGLGKAIHPAMRVVTTPVFGDLMISWSATNVGALQRAGVRAPLLFAHPERVPPEWYTEQYRLSQLPHFLTTTLGAIRAQVDITGQRKVLLGRLPELKMPVLVVWGERDPIFPVADGRAAIDHLPNGRFAVIPDCGHLPHVEQPANFAAVVSNFLRECT